MRPSRRPRWQTDARDPKPRLHRCPLWMTQRYHSGEAASRTPQPWSRPSQDALTRCRLFRRSERKPRSWAETKSQGEPQKQRATPGLECLDGGGMSCRSMLCRKTGRYTNDNAGKRITDVDMLLTGNEALIWTAETDVVKHCSRLQGSGRQVEPEMEVLLLVLLRKVEGARSDAQRHTSPMLCFRGGAQAEQERTSRTRRRRTEGGWLVGNR